MAATAFGGTTHPHAHAGTRVRAAAAARPARPFAATGPVVALGDSYTAGLLAPPANGAVPLGCGRSAVNYATLVAKRLKAPGLVDAACESAGVADMTSAEKTPMGTNPPQFSALSPADSLVMLTLSGDDLGFTHVLNTCMLLSLTDPDGHPCQARYTAGGSDQLARLIAGEAPRLTAVLAAVHARAPHARVLLLGYPDLFPRRGGCWPVVPIANGDIGYLRATELRLNAMLAGAASVTGSTYVDTYQATTGRDMCKDGDVKDVEGLIPTSLTYSFHPNARGQAAMAAQVLAALRAA
jgi:lysophospholipase L1-like esterase